MSSEMPAAADVTVDASDAAGQERRVVRRAARRLLPLVFLGYLMACLDRGNLGFAALTMMDSLRLDAAQFGFAAGIFFVGYCAGGLPSNLVLVRVGARRWLALMLALWGLIACAMALVTDAPSLYAMRIALGLAEAGFVPGAIVYLAFWFPAEFRARAFAFLAMATPAAMVVGSPLSAALLYLDGLGPLHGWQWLFVLEGLPAIALGAAYLRYLTDAPRDADWLDARERELLARALARDPPARQPRIDAPIRRALADGRTWRLGLIGIGLSASSYGVIFFMPQIIASFGGSHLQTGFLSALPFLVALGAMHAWSRHADRTREQRLHIALPLGLAALGLVTASLAHAPLVQMLALIAVSSGSYMATPPYWQLIPTYFQKGEHAATAAAIVTMTATLVGAFVLPSVIGYLKLVTGTFAAGLQCAAVLAAASGAIALTLRPPPPADR